MLASLVGCAASPHASLSARLEECDLVSAGELGLRVTDAFYAPDACYRDCLVAATCMELSAALCRRSIDLLRRCDQRCAHRCPDGALIATDQVCDGSQQCTDGSDEAGCATFRCRDGAALPIRERCDGTMQCPFGDDETGCGGFTCESISGGVVMGDYYRCDGYSSCVDGSDERGCPTYRCADGIVRVHREQESPRCDGLGHCADGSDEAGCAELTPRCVSP